MKTRFSSTNPPAPDGMVNAIFAEVLEDGIRKIAVHIPEGTFDSSPSEGGGGGTWGSITGTLSDQTDLQDALNEKVAGPASATDNAIARFDGTTGKLIQDGGITIADGASGTLAGSNSGDVTLAGSPNYITIAAQVITRALIDLASHITGRLPFANLVQVAASKLVGRGSASGTGDAQEITLGTGLSMSGTTLNATGGDVVGPSSSVASEIVLFDGTTGKLVKRATGTGVVHAASGVYSAANVDLASEVTGDLPFANLVQASAASRLVGRRSGSAGDFEEVSLGSKLSMSSGAVLDVGALAESDITDLVSDLAGKVAANAPISGATKTKITYDSKGLVTAGTDASISDLAVPTADVAWNSKKITNLADPGSAQDAATKAYVDSAIGGGTSTLATVIGFVINTGSAGNDVGPDLLAPRSGTISKVKFVTKQSDPSVALTFRIKQNGVSIFSSNQTVAAGTAAGTVTTLSSALTSSPLSVTADDVFTIDITAGASAWKFTVQIET
jgi:hypothetical protein